MIGIVTDGWVRRHGKLARLGFEDVYVTLDELNPANCMFVGHVGRMALPHGYLEDAMDWCERVAAGRQVMRDTTPLTEGPPAEVRALPLDRGMIL